LTVHIITAFPKTPLDLSVYHLLFSSRAR